MLYELLQALEGFPGAGLFRYISFRAAGAALTAFALAVLLGRPVIVWLARLGIGEDIDSPSAQLSELHADKQDTPTMGGVFLVGAIIGASLLWMRFDGANRFSLPGVALVAYFGCVGLIDDWIKLRVAGKRGLSTRGKQLLLTVGAVVIAWLLLGYAGLEREHGGPGFIYRSSRTSRSVWRVPEGSLSSSWRSSC